MIEPESASSMDSDSHVFDPVRLLDKGPEPVKKAVVKVIDKTLKGF